jgi:DNA-directed RNA polymerase specialized sigma24 family protein
LIDWEEHTRLEEIARKQKEIDDAKAKAEEEARLEEERLALLPEEEREAILLEKA